MRKSITVTCVCIALSLVTLAAAYAQPSEIAIENAISWAESLVGQASFPYVNGVGSCPSANWCTEFVSNAYGRVAADFNAYTLWCLSDKHPGDWKAPRGSLVFFDRTADTGVWGHVALCTGDGNVVEAGYARIKTSTIRWENAAPYLGWAWPPSYWLSRSSNSP